MANSLRLVVAQLTDVGRKRERNQDNAAHVIPADSDLLREKGALFVVCDGMGGHAAGEVAAELGVNTMRESYYQTQHEDVITGLARAIEDANNAIYTHARTHPEHAGMGTTCVAIVITEGRAYVINIGDSRAYLIRNGQMRQVTRDHSWVAEQQRMGLLTAEQARMHAHRNVITRSLGTQPSITADLFVEPIFPGDRFLLCSDGLHGYVAENEVASTIVSYEPQHAAQRLIDQANNNGGPDNITAIIIHVVDTPIASGEVTLPTDLVSRAETPIDESQTQPLSTSAMQENAEAASAARTTPVVAAAAAHAAAHPGRETQALPQQGSHKRRRGRGVAAALMLVALLLLVIAGAGGWYVFYGRGALGQEANAQARHDLTSASQVLQRAANEPPAQALADLGQVRTTLLADENNSAISQATHKQLEDFLGTQVVPAVRDALRQYNALARVVPVEPTGVASCLSSGASGSSGAAVSALAASTWSPPASNLAAGGNATATNAQLLYALQGGQIQAVLVPLTSAGTWSGTQATCQTVHIANISLVNAITVDGSTLTALVQNTSGSYGVVTLTPVGASGGLPSYKIQTRFTLPSGTTPTLLATSGTQTYVAYSGSAGAGIWRYQGVSPTTPSAVLTLPLAAISMTLANGTPYLLLSDGELGEITANFQYAALPVTVLTPVAPADPSAYAISMPVPTPRPTTVAPVSTAGADTNDSTPATTPETTGNATPAPTTTSGPATTTLFTAGGTLTTAAGTPTHLLVEDAANGRVVWLDGSSDGSSLTPGSQFVANPTTGTGQIATASRDGSLLIFTWTENGLSLFLAPSAVSSGS